MQETALALLAFAETYPEGVWHCLASTGRLTRVISTGAVTSAPRRRRRRLALGSLPKRGSDSALGGVSVGSGIALIACRVARPRIAHNRSTRRDFMSYTSEAHAMPFARTM